MSDHPLGELIDSHCHLDYDYSPKTTDDLIREAEQNGVTTLVTVGTQPDSCDTLPKFAEQYPHVFFTLGVHPHDAKLLDETALQRIRTGASHPKCVAIGEIGLDYYYDHSPREIQREKLQLQLDLALELDLPIVVHARDAEADLTPLLENYAAKVSQGKCPGVIHCFTGTAPFANACLAAGFNISFSGIVTFKNSEELRQTSQQVPLDRIMVETDSPYLAPVPFRGKKCEPSMVRKTAETLARLKGITIQEFARHTVENTRRAFRI